MNDRFESFVSEWRASAPVGPTLNVGCGWDRLPDAINLDIACIDTADVVGSVDGPWLPVRDDSVACVVAEDVLEHVDHIAAMKELHRVLKPGGLLLLSSVHFSCRDVWVDPTHRRGYSLRTFDFFTGEFADRGYYFDFTFSQLEQGIIDFPANRAWLLTGNPLVRKFANRWPDLYELTGACRAFPAGNVLVALRK